MWFYGYTHNMNLVICKCGKEFKNYKKDPSRGKFCSKVCMYKYRAPRPTGLNYKIKVVNKGWIRKGQVLFKKDSVPYFDKSIGYMKISVGGNVIKYHRHVLEKHLNRKLLPTEIVHHKNHDKLDNRVKNLEIMDRGDHMRLHWNIKKQHAK